MSTADHKCPWHLGAQEQTMPHVAMPLPWGLEGGDPGFRDKEAALQCKPR